jgi:isopentenyl diphosphate isomerase/L-lactate dehydrogenase-like FMN-dependent dehydrogenase
MTVTATIGTDKTSVNLTDFERLAHELLEAGTWDYFAGGSGDEVTLLANRQAFQRLRLRPRVRTEERLASAATTVLETPVTLPVLIAPTAYHGLVHPDAECATAQGAGQAGTIMVASVNSNRTLEEIAAAATGPLWLQLYLTGDRIADQDILARAERCKFSTLVLTVDRPVYGARERDLRNGFRLPPHLRAANYGAERDLSARSWATWAAVEWLASTARLPVVVKGILCGDDARIAAEHGAAGIIVSNHGGRQLDGALAGVEALAEVVDAAAGTCEIYCDGGIRRGSDVIKALALGARAVLIGRPTIWGLAVDGADGVSQVLQLLKDEIVRDLTLCGVTSPGDLDRSFVTSIPILP